MPLGEEGEIQARGYQSMLGYHAQPEATAAAIDADGWLHTGDLGTMDARGFVRVTGRLSDMTLGIECLLTDDDNAHLASLDLAGAVPGAEFHARRLSASPEGRSSRPPHRAR